jgi:hypothetical protein
VERPHTVNAPDTLSKPNSRPAWPLLAWIPAALVLYILSTGPAVKLLEHDIVTEKQIETFYAPLV